MRTGLNLTALRIYPVKSLAPIAIRSAAIEQRGIVGDRRWMLVDSDGEFISQRAYPKLALCLAEPASTGICIKAPGNETIKVEYPTRSAKSVRSRVWKDRLDLLDAGETPAELFSDFLGTPVRLVFQTEEARRPVDPRFRTSPSDHVSLSDGYPLLLISTFQVNSSFGFSSVLSALVNHCFNSLISLIK